MKPHTVVLCIKDCTPALDFITNCCNLSLCLLGVQVYSCRCFENAILCQAANLINMPALYKHHSQPQCCIPLVLFKTQNQCNLSMHTNCHAISKYFKLCTICLPFKCAFVGIWNEAILHQFGFCDASAIMNGVGFGFERS